MEYTASYLERTLEWMVAATETADPALIKRLIFHLPPNGFEPTARAVTDRTVCRLLRGIL